MRTKYGATGSQYESTDNATCMYICKWDWMSATENSQLSISLY